MKWMNDEQVDDLVSQVRFFDRLSFTSDTTYEYFSYFFRMTSEFHIILPHNTKTVTFWLDLLYYLSMTEIPES